MAQASKKIKALSDTQNQPTLQASELDDVSQKPRPLGEILMDRGVISPDQLRVALTEQKRSREQLGKLLVKLGFATEAVIRDVISEQLQTESIDLVKTMVDSEALEMVPKEMARRYKILPVSFDTEKQQLTVAMSDTFNLVILDQLRASLGGIVTIKPLLSGESEIAAAIDQFYGVALTVDSILKEIETGKIEYIPLTTGEGDEYAQPLVRLIDALLADAVKRAASDIHFEPEAGFLRVRYRIDGVLRQVRSLHLSYWSAMTVRLKVLSNMNIAETRSPQDGRFSMTLAGRRVDFRASVHPTSYGENFVLRILDRTRGIVPLDGLGLQHDALNLLKILMSRPEGIILVTGPTGSGKTTSLYSMLSHINKEGVNIMTLEDPVEYPIQLLRQTSVSEAAKLDFANGIRSIMRQDPDIILVGEVRDKDTADMAMRAAMTGHQVYSTLHTNSAIGAIPRLLDLGILPDILAGNVIGIVAQRLVRKLCTVCCESYDPDPIEKKLLGIDEHATQILYRPVGCDECDGVGYRGRLALMEVFRVDSDIDELIISHSSMRALRRMAHDKGFVPLVDDGIRRIIEGITSIEEVSRVIDLTERIT